MNSNDLKQKNWLCLSLLITILIVSITYGKDETNTILVAHFMNGNTDAFKSRIYLWNPSENTGVVTVRVFTLPRTGTGDLAQELTDTPIDLGTLKEKSALTIKLDEDILTFVPGITRPYKDTAGNLTLELRT
jgi:hypothetical protein